MLKWIRWMLCAALVAATAASAAPQRTEANDDFPQFRFAGQVLEPAELDYNPTDEIIFPTIIKASDYLDQPLGAYYLYYAPHDAPGGINLAYSDSLDGPWTEYEGNPLIPNAWEPHYRVSHVSSPHVLWDDEGQRFLMYFHGENTTTRVATSTDGIHFDYGKVAVNTAMFPPGLTEASYARVFEYTIPNKKNKYIMLFMGVRDNLRKIYLAWSDDGFDWTVQPEPLVSPTPQEGNQIAAPLYFPWNGKHYVVYHSNKGNMYVTEVGANFNKENHLGVFYDSDAVIDAGRAASPSILFEGTEMYMFYERGDRLGGRIHYAKAPRSGPAPESRWNVVDDEFGNYKANWAVSGTAGSAVQHDGFVSIADDKAGSSGSYFYLTRRYFTAPSGAFTFEFRGKTTAPNTVSEISVRDKQYLISVYLKHGENGTAQNKATSPTKTFALDTTIDHTYRVVVRPDFTYDLYVDGELAWNGASSLGSGSDIIKLGGDNAYTAAFDLDYFKMATGEMSPWNAIDDEMSDAAERWSVGEETLGDGVVTVDGAFLTLDGEAPDDAFTFETRVRTGADRAWSEVTVTGDVYEASLHFRQGMNGLVGDAPEDPEHTYKLDTTIYHTYRVVVRDDGMYDVYVDGAFAWRGAARARTEGPLVRIGSEGEKAAVDVDVFRLTDGELPPERERAP